MKINRSGDRVCFWCPGCDSVHCVDGSWEFNGDDAMPTIRPSILVHSHGTLDEEGNYITTPQCHSYVTNGSIEFLSDSTHGLAGKGVQLPEWET